MNLPVEYIGDVTVECCVEYTIHDYLADFSWLLGRHQPIPEESKRTSRSTEKRFSSCSIISIAARRVYHNCILECWLNDNTENTAKAFLDILCRFFN